MPDQADRPPEVEAIGRWLIAARRAAGLSQAELAKKSGLKRQHITFFETGSRVPDLHQLLRIARALGLPWQWFLSGTDRPGEELRDIVLELQHSGMSDIWVDLPTVPGAFRRTEEVVTLALAGPEPEARIVEGIPAILAWNHWHPALLRGFARSAGSRTLHRLAWLAEIALALERRGGFPGGCVSKKALGAFVDGIKAPSHDRWDGLGRASEKRPSSPVWKRWRINYPASLATFRQRAQALASLRNPTK